MNAYIKLWGNEYLVLSIRWFEDGEYASVAFVDEHQKTNTIFQDVLGDQPDAETNRDAELLYADLEKIVIWKQK